LALLTALLAAFAAWRLSQGPVSIGFLRPYVMDSLRQDRTSLRFTVEDTVLAWSGWERPLDLRATGVRALDPDGRVIATVPQAAIGVSFRGLLRGLFAPTTIDLIGPRATALRTEDGGFALMLGSPEGAASDALESLIAVLGSPPDRTHSLGYLRRVSITGARLDVDDRALGLAWNAPRANVIFTKDVRGIRIDASLDVDFDGTIAHFEGEGEYRASDRTAKAVVWFTDLSPALVASKFPQLKPLDAIKLPTAGYVGVGLDEFGKIVSGEVELRSASGRIEYPELWTNGLEVKSALLKSTLTRAPDRLAISEFRVELDGLTVGLRGSGTRLDDGIAVAGELNATDVKIDSWGRIWPKGVAEGARDWLTANMEHGQVPEAYANVSLRLPDDPTQSPRVEALTGTFRVEDTTVHYMRPLPPVVKASGTGTFDADHITIKVNTGALKQLRIDEGTIRFSKLDRHPSQVDIDVVVRGPLRDPLEVLDLPRFRYMHKLGIDPAAVEGQSATRLVISLPTISSIPMSSVSLKVASNLQGVAIKNALLGRDLSDGTLTLKLDNGGMDLSGNAKVAGLPSEIVWVENFNPKEPEARRYRLRTNMDDAARTSFGVDLAPYLVGPTPVELAFVQPVKGPSDLQVRIGLEDATLALSDLEWKKPPGQKGEATMVASLVDGKLRDISALTVDAPDLKANASVAFAADGKTPSRIDITRFQSGVTDLKGTIQRRGDGGYNIDIAGPSLYASRLVHPEDDKAARKTTKPPLDITFNVGQAWLRSPVPLQDIKGRLVYNGDEWSAGTLDATMPGGRSLALRLEPEGATSRFSLQSDDAGEALRIFGIYDEIVLGGLAVNATRSGGIDGPWKGNMAVTEFRAVKAPVLAKLLTVASLTGMASILSGQGIYFTKLDAPFTVKDDVLSLENARLVGSELGLTAEGDIDFGKDQVKVTGTIVPAYTINSLLGNIPLLGRVFTGSEGSGIFAATYKIEGPVDDPSVSVNPLSMLAPGFLRNLVEGIFSGAVRSGEEMEQPITPQ